MKRILILTVAVGIMLRAGLVSAQELSPFNGCDLKNSPAPTNIARTIWKPKASHFSKAVMVVSRHFYPYEVDVRMYTPVGQFIEKAKIKSSGIKCAITKHPECLYAATVIWKKLGSYYGKKYGEVWVRVKNAKNHGKGCRYYQLPNAKNKYNIKG